MSQRAIQFNAASLPAELASINASRLIGPANILVLYRAGDTVGQAVAEYYQSVRSVPAANVVAVTMAWTPATNDMLASDADNFMAAVLPILQQNDIRSILTVNWFPQTVNEANVVFGSFLSSMPLFAALPDSSRYNLNSVSPSAWGTILFINDYSATIPLAFPFVTGTVNGAVQYGLKPPPKYTSAYPASFWIPHFRLEVSPVAAGDNRIPNASVENYLKKIIDDSMAAEAAQYQDAGNVIAVASGSYSGTMTVALPTALEAYGKAINVYTANLELEVMAIPRSGYAGPPYLFPLTPGPPGWSRTVTGNHLMCPVVSGTTAATEPVWNVSGTGALTKDGTVTWSYIMDPPPDMFPPGANTNTPNRIAHTYIPIEDVFFRVVGYDSYYASCTEPEQQSDMSYRQGAIVMFSQSYGYTPNPVQGLDYDFGAPLPNVMADTACVTATPIQYTNANGFVVDGFYFASTVATPTVGVSGNNIVLKSAGTVVATIPLSGTMRQQYATIQAALPTGWTMTVDDPFVESRCSNAIKNGACAAFGACAEPQTLGAVKGYGLQDLWDGASLGEIGYVLGVTTLYLTPAYRLYMIGDPLYRPFGYKLGEFNA